MINNCNKSYFSTVFISLISLFAGSNVIDAADFGITTSGVNYGIQASGSTGGGLFYDLDVSDSGYARVAFSHYGIVAAGDDAGGHFQDSNSSGFANVGYGDTGIEASGYFQGGYFSDSNDSGYARVGYLDEGISAHGNVQGGYFEDDDSSGKAHVAYGHTGIEASGDVQGGLFIDSTSSNYGRVGYSTYKISGNGQMSFIQNHPKDPDQVIVYTAPEGDEVATYTRGTAQLVNGEARVPLGETFKWVTNPDIGLTAHLTAKGEAVIYVASVSTEELVVRTIPGFADNVSFDYMVYGLRIGFEETSIVQNKTKESKIPAMDDHEAIYNEFPHLRRFNAQERIVSTRERSGRASLPDMSASVALRDAIGVFDLKAENIESSEPLSATASTSDAIAKRSLVFKKPLQTEEPGLANLLTPVIEKDLEIADLRQELAKQAQILVSQGNALAKQASALLELKNLLIASDSVASLE